MKKITILFVIGTVMLVGQQAFAGAGGTPVPDASSAFLMLGGSFAGLALLRKFLRK